MLFCLIIWKLQRWVLNYYKRILIHYGMRDFFVYFCPIYIVKKDV